MSNRHDKCRDWLSSFNCYIIAMLRTIILTFLPFQSSPSLFTVTLSDTLLAVDYNFSVHFLLTFVIDGCSLIRCNWTRLSFQWAQVWMKAWLSPMLIQPMVPIAHIRQHFCVLCAIKQFWRFIISEVFLLGKINETKTEKIKSWHSPTDPISNFPWTCSSCSHIVSNTANKYILTYPTTEAGKNMSQTYNFQTFFCPIPFFIELRWQICCYYIFWKKTDRFLSIWLITEHRAPTSARSCFHGLFFSFSTWNLVRPKIQHFNMCVNFNARLSVPAFYKDSFSTM